MGLGLQGISLFKDLSAEALAQLDSVTRWKQVRRGQELISHLSTSDDVYCVAEGTLRTTLFARNGKEIILRDILEGSITGEFAAIDSRPRAASVIAVTDGLVGGIRAADFRAFLRSHPSLMEALLIDTISLVRHMTDKLFEITALSVKARIHIELLRLSSTVAEHRDNQIIISPAPTHADFANQIGSHREAVTRELNQLASLGIIKSSRGKIAVLDIAALAQKSSSALGLDASDFFPALNTKGTRAN